MRYKGSCLFLLAALSTTLLATASVVNSKEMLPPLKPLFDVAALRASHGKPAKVDFTCPAVPTPQINVGIGSKYKPGTGSTEIDPKAAKVAADLSAKLKSFSAPLAQMANSYVTSSPGDGRLARCALKWLATWARAGAASLPNDRLGEAVRVQVLAAAATAYLQIADEPSLSVVDVNAAKAWIQRLAKRVRSDFSTAIDLPSRRNNHRYWAGWAVMASSIALNDRSMFNWAIASADVGIDAIDQYGFLPLELERRQLSLGYHFYALEPLVLLAEAGSRNGVDLYARNSHAILRLAKRANSGYEAPNLFQSRSGYAQDRTFAKTGGKIGSTLIVSRRFASLDSTRWKSRFKKFESVSAGGDIELLFDLK